eukprot:346290-Prymnesium_polylepis.1
MRVDRGSLLPAGCDFRRGHGARPICPTDHVQPLIGRQLQLPLHVSLKMPSISLEARNALHLAEEQFISSKLGDAATERLRVLQPIWRVLFAKPRLRSEDAASGLPFEVRPTCLHLQQDAAEVLARLCDLDEPIFAPALRESALLAHHASTACLAVYQDSRTSNRDLASVISPT